MKKLLYLLLLLISLNIHSNNSIRGHILDSQTESHLPFVSISLRGTHYQTTTDETGHFVLNNIPDGNYIINAQLMGYKTNEQSIELKKNSIKHLTIYLDTDNQVLDEVSVIGSLDKINRQLSSIIVTPLTSKTLEATNSTTLSQGLNYIPGVRVETNCQNCGTQEVRINGLGGQYSQMLIDGKRIFGAMSQLYGLEQFPLNLIEKIEVIRGGGSVLLPASTIGGAINLITKEPEKNLYEAGYNMSLIDGKSVVHNIVLNTSIINKSKKSGASLFGNIRHRNPWDANNDGFSEIGKNKTGSLGIRTFYKPSISNNLKFEYHYISEERRGGDNINRPPHESEITEATNYTIHSGSVGFEQFFHEKNQKIFINITAQDVARDSYYGAEKDLNAYGNGKELSLSTDIRYEHNMDKFLFMPAKFSGGILYEHSNLKDQIEGYNHHLTQVINISTLYLQNEWKNNKATYTLGIKADKHNKIKNINIIPRASVRYNIFDNINLRGTYSMGYRAPEITGQDLDAAIIDAKATIIQLADKLKPERSNTINGGADYAIYKGDFYSYFLIEGFYTKLNHAFVDEFNGEAESGHSILLRRNGSGAYVYGINLETTIQPTNWLELQGGYTWQQARYTKAEAWSDDESVKPTKKMLRTPNHYGFFSLTTTSNKNISAALSGVYTGSMITPHFAGFIEKDEMKKTRDFIDLTLKVSYSLNIGKNNKTEFNIGVQNIFNQIQKDFDKGKNRDSNYIYGPSLPRTYFIGFKISSL